MRQIVIISLFGNINNINSRLHKIANAFNEKKITIYTPDFSHAEKKYKNIITNEHNQDVTINYIHVPAYKKNLSVWRIYSHFVFSLKLHFQLRRLATKPHVFICLMPPSFSAFICGKYCKKKNIKFVIDVIDLWPDSLFPIYKRNPLIKLIIWPWQLITNKTYKMADYISAESKLYALNVIKINNCVPWSYTYLGVDVLQIQNLILSSNVEIENSEGERWICYGGSLGNSYDFESILLAIKHIHELGIRYKMFFVGEGENRKYIEDYAKANNLNVNVTGRLEYKDYLYYLSKCDIGINSFKKNTLVVHSYKFNDYVATKLFILNNLPGETSEMISEYKIGLNYSDNLSNVLEDVCVNWNSYNNFKNNMDLLINSELDTKVIYKSLADNILKLT